jgi:hypothetical protein
VNVKEADESWGCCRSPVRVWVGSTGWAGSTGLLDPFDGSVTVVTVVVVAFDC